MIRRQEVYNKKLSGAVNRYWIEKYIYQFPTEKTWTLTPLEKGKEGMWTVHVNEVGNNFTVNLSTESSKLELGEGIKARNVGKQSDSLLRFERI